MANSRNANYSIDEDINLCHAYMEISQDPEIGISQKKDVFWFRIAEAYNLRKSNESMPDRSARSVESRMQTILSAVSKFKSCIQQIEYMKPSGISENDLMKRAKELLMMDPKYAKGFRFDHVWDILKEFEKFACKTQKPRNEVYSSHSLNLGTPTTDSPTSPTSIPFSVNLSDDSGSASGYQRPLGVKKSKLKKKKNEDVYTLVNTLLESQKKMDTYYEKIEAYYEDTKQAQQEQIATLKTVRSAYQEANELAQRNADEQTMLIDPLTISDPVRRLFIQQKQTKIMQKMRDELAARPDDNFAFQNYFSDIGGSGSGGADLGDY